MKRLSFVFILIFLSSCQTKQKVVEVKNLKNEDTSLELSMIESDMVRPSIKQEKLFNPKSILSEKTHIDEYKNEEEVLSRSLEKFNKGQWQSVIHELNRYLEKEEKNKSLLTYQASSSKSLRKIQLTLALAYIEADDEDHAWPILNKLIINENHWEPIYLALCDIYFKKKAFALSKNVALKGMDKLINPSPQIYIEYARAEINLNNFNLARQSLEQIHVLYPKNSDVIGWLGILDFKQNKIVDACYKIKQSYSLNKENNFFAYNNAVCLIRSRDKENAHSVLKLALLNQNAQPGFYYLGGVLAAQEGKWLESRKYWENFLKMSDLSDPRRLLVVETLSIPPLNR